MENVRSSAFFRDDTFFGVCHALGEDFGFNPFYARIAFAALLFWNPLVMIGTYAMLGVAVLASRLLFPDPRPKAVTEAAFNEEAMPREPELATAANEREEDRERMPVAA